MSQDSILSGGTDLGQCGAYQDSDGVGPEVTGAGGSGETPVKSVDTEIGMTDCAVDTGPLWTDSSCESSRHLVQETSDGDDFGEFESVAMSEDFAVFESPLADGPMGNWAAATESVPAAVHNNEDDYDFDDFETAESDCAPVSCVGLDEGEVSISCKSWRLAASKLQEVILIIKGLFSLL
jgi:hypothetical protein